MTHMHFVSAHFGGKPPWIHQVRSETVSVTSAYYTDSNTPSRHNSMTPRLKAKIPKMLEWQFVDADWYVWMDSSVKLNNEITDLPKVILEVAGDNPLCLFRHTAGTTIREEADRVRKSINNNHEYLVKRYDGEPIREQLTHYYGDPNFKDNKLFATTFFAYNREARPMMQKWFEQNVLWSTQCQISFPYILQKSGLTYSLFEGTINEGNPYFTWHWQEREKHLLK